MERKSEPWLFRCPACSFWLSQLRSNPRAEKASLLIEARRSPALYSLRREEARQSLKALSYETSLEGKTLLDIGCAHGWFLDAAFSCGMKTFAIEPEADVAVQVAGNHQVSVGFFPSVPETGESAYDVISFNDVFEHLTDLDLVVSTCRQLLKPNGKLLLSLPDSRGIFFRLANLLAAWGVKAPLHRLWQVNYPSPHQTYFTADNLTQFLTARGFTLLHRSHLRSVSLNGLWNRVHLDRPSPSLSSIALYLTLCLSYPLLVWVLPSDHLLQIYERAD